ncbi:MAG: tRNA 5-methoxyuridine(34)/uridine 5-oxyacetic acid(34) synthase CmoB [Methylococcales symbiont of Hymedesmia sp. n. MRB-2018]|nr:MAG: tRNA 5-methoxyuridine(34)/uridine 5-oxyacetic acid(34) synthase CmoB [Methylococcales symbiont of Hymedesmia sp. n. MRB-2018]
MIDYKPLFQALIDAKADNWVEIIPQQLKRAFEPNRNGGAIKWLEIIANLPSGMASTADLNSAWVKIGQSKDIDSKTHSLLLEQLKSFHPWRKGPYDLFGIKIDTEWRSDWKWDRLKDSIASLNNRLVLDVGCANGYHCWRMLGVGARMVVGVEPLLLNVLQFQLTRLLHGEAPIYVLPIGLEQIPTKLNAFDSVFSMGVLYHRRSPIDHLLALKDCLRPGGELVLETLVIEGGLGEMLLPKGRYAKMRNVWFLPSCETLISWMERCGFKSCRVIDVNKTMLEEQHSTEWMRFHSLKEFLDPNNLNLTCEGLPAPRRAIIVANAP